jgi:hypothetical protein
MNVYNQNGKRLGLPDGWLAGEWKCIVCNIMSLASLTFVYQTSFSLS